MFVSPAHTTAPFLPLQQGWTLSKQPSCPVLIHAHVLRTMASHELGLCKWQAASEHLDAATRIFESLGETASLVLCKQLQALQHLLQGRMKKALALASSSIADATRLREAELGRVGRVLAAAALLHMGRLRECTSRLNELQSLDHLSSDRAVQTIAIACRAALALIQGRTEQAFDDEKGGLQLVLNTQIVHAFWVPGITLVGITLVKMLSKERQRVNHQHIQRCVWRGLNTRAPPHYSQSFHQLHNTGRRAQQPPWLRV